MTKGKNAVVVAATLPMLLRNRGREREFTNEFAFIRISSLSPLSPLSLSLFSRPFKRVLFDGEINYTASIASYCLLLLSLYLLLIRLSRIWPAFVTFGDSYFSFSLSLLLIETKCGRERGTLTFRFLSPLRKILKPFDSA